MASLDGRGCHGSSTLAICPPSPNDAVNAHPRPYYYLENFNVALDWLRDRYRELASRHHPDHGGDPARMREVNQAYERIRNAKKPVARVGTVRGARNLVLAI